VRDGDQLVISAPPTALHSVLDTLKERNIPALGGEIAMIPKNTVTVEGKDAAQLLRLVEALEELDDVARVHSNFDIDADAMVEVAG
jgi:transcriptional/translational regulatory protein YebC/TACO1